MADTTTVRVYDSDLDKIDSMVPDGNMPAKIREIVNKAERYEDQA